VMLLPLRGATNRDAQEVAGAADSAGGWSGIDQISGLKGAALGEAGEQGAGGTTYETWNGTKAQRGHEGEVPVVGPERCNWTECACRHVVGIDATADGGKRCRMMWGSSRDARSCLRLSWEGEGRIGRWG